MLGPNGNDSAASTSTPMANNPATTPIARGADFVHHHRITHVPRNRLVEDHTQDDVRTTNIATSIIASA